MPDSPTPSSPGIGEPLPTHFVAAVDETPAVVDAVRVREKKSNLWIDAWRDMRVRPMFWISVVIILVVVLVSLFPGLFTQVDPRACTLANSNGAPSAGHPLGFNRQGCDVYSRIIYGASTSVSVGLLVIAITFVVGTLMGSLAGFFGGFLDTVLSRAGDIFFSIPYILAAVVVMSVLADYRNPLVIAFAIGGFSWPITARIVRSEVLRVKNADFVMAAGSLGLSRGATLVRHVLPNALAPAIVVTTLSLASAIVAEATLSFLGVGLPPGQYISWGNDISAAQLSLRTDPMPLIWPSLALSITVLGFILLGETVRDALDPKARARR
ncbi:oligopeptide transport system permease protein [Microbacterium ginsengiterrae]|uniref:Oligopeptide transport system permease protein n=1 Tax=Microbacterium ginsengiterrae TaxID=546115 RepID=A0A7W9FBT4_9MICO|nr:ABC transporter permease [Microbacterium ginsengiterrae]MBB5743666.1 oligopeptide transport system permease protein [Microbacterium ginsengiterrae]